MGAVLAVPRSHEEHDQMALAAVELQTGPLQMLYLGMMKFDQEWKMEDFCYTTPPFYWASGQPDGRGPYIAYAPPGMAGTPTGWYARRLVDAHLGLCQLKLCYRPDCPQ